MPNAPSQSPRPLDRRLPLDAWAWVDGHACTLAPERLSVADAAGRMLAAAICADADVPSRPLAAGDGYAVVAAATAGAGAYNPLPLAVCEPAHTASPSTAPAHRDATPVVWGQPMPRGADAVLPLDDAEPTAGGIEVYAAVASGGQISRVGDECVAGDVVLHPGRPLRPQDLAMLRLLGIAEIDVVRSPRVGLVSSRAERDDVDGDMLRALIARDGGTVVFRGFADGNRERLAGLLAADDLDLMLCVGGTALGTNDQSSSVLAELGRVDIRGVAISPGDTLTLGGIGTTPVCLLPGPPLTCFSAYELVVGRLVRRLAGRNSDWTHAVCEATLARKIASPLGTLQLCRVRLRGALAEPLDLAGGRLLRSAVDADGFVLVPLQCEGYPEGERVQVFLF